MAVKHTVRTSVALANRAAGFHANHHPLADDYFNNTGYGNHPDFNMLGVDASGAAVGRGCVSTSGWNAPRQADGALPVPPHLRLAANSALIDKGVDVGLPYRGSAPDLGAFESSGSTVAGSSRH